MANIQRNIIIGADAQQFHDSMRTINSQLSRIDASVRRMDKGMATSVATGQMMAHVIRDIGHAVVNYMNTAVDAAAKLPDGIFKSVDALKAARTEAEKLDEAFGVFLSNSATKLTQFRNDVKAQFAGFFENWDKEGFWSAVFTTGDAQQKLGYEILQNTKDEIAYQKALQIIKEHDIKIKEDAAKAAEKQAIKEKELAAALRIQRMELEGLAKLARIEIDDMVWNTPAKPANQTGQLADFDPLEYDEEFQQFLLDAVENTNAMNEALQNQMAILGQVGKAFEDVFYTALTAGEDFFAQMGRWLENYIKRLAAAAAASALLSAFSGGSLTFLNAFKGMMGLGNLTRMAHGGVVNRATPVVAGEAGPEAIIPLNRLNQMGGTLVTKISGRDLLIMLQRESNLKPAVYG